MKQERSLSLADFVSNTSGVAFEGCLSHMTVLASLDAFRYVNSYDEKGRLIMVQTVDRRTNVVLGHTEYHYSLGRLSWQQTWEGGRARSEIRYDYDSEGNLERYSVYELVYDGCRPIRLRTYIYDADDNLIEESSAEIPN